MSALEAVFQHRAVDLGQQVRPDPDDWAGSDPEHVAVVGGVMDLAEGKPVADGGDACPFTVRDDVRSVNMVGQPVARTAYDIDRKGVVMFPTNFRDLEWLVKRVPLPVVVKGVLRGDDARRCVDCGVKGVMVSNHGGRHLDTTVTTAEVLAEIVAEVGGSAEVYVDGGIRRGTDIVKALALGARAVLLGRPPLWGLSVAGADGVAAVLKHMREELVRVMQLCGTASLAALKPDLVKT